MKIIVCGAGPVGTGIARQLSQEDNDVTILDIDPERLSQVSDSMDVTATRGFPSHPTVLENAGASNAEMIIAVTTSDEVNMVICQVAHSIFNIPIKVARIRHQNYLQPIWKDLYRHDHLPIDYIISPELEVANAIISRLHVPGALDSIEFADGKMKVIEIRCHNACQFLGKTISKIQHEAEGIDMSILAIKRGDELIIPDDHTKMLVDDEMYFVVRIDQVTQAMKYFGYAEKEARRVLIVGGGNIGLSIARQIEADDEHDINVKLIELGQERSQYLAGKLVKTTVINGNSLDQDILSEANIESTETLIAVTNDDEVNILASLLGKRSGAQRAFTLINRGRSYEPLVSTLGIDVVINPREMTVSSILQYTRRGKVLAAHSIWGGQAEVIEVETTSESAIVGSPVKAVKLPSCARIGALLRGEQMIIAEPDTNIEEGDRLIVVSRANQIHQVDAVLSARNEYF